MVPAAEAERTFTEGEKFFILEDYTKALSYFQKVLEFNPDNATAYYKIAEIYLKGSNTNDLVLASENIENALKREKKNKFFYLLAARIYSMQHQFKKAAESLEVMLKEINGTDEYLYELASIYLEDDRLDEAASVYNHAESALGINELSSLQKQRIFLLKGKTNEAIAEGDRLIQSFPDEERYVLTQAEMLTQQGQAARGIVYLDNFINAHPDASNAKVLRAGLYRDAGQEQKSKDAILQLMDDPEVALSSKILMIGTYNATLSQNKSKKIEDIELEVFVLNLFKKLLAAHPNEPDVHLVGGDLFLTLEKNEEACAEYRQVIKAGGSSYEVWQNLLFLEMQSNQLDSVIVHSEQATELFPNQGMIYYFSGIAYARKKNYHESSSSLEQAKKLSKGNSNLLAEINSILGDNYNSTKEYEKSDKSYEDALTINPNNDYVLNNYAYFLSLRKANLERAEQMAALVVKNHPNNSSYLDTYAWVLYQESKFKEAKKVMEKAMANQNISAVLHEHYGDILFQLGEVDEAVIQWQKAKSLGEENEALNKKIVSRKVQ